MSSNEFDSSSPNAAKIAGLLADPSRRAVFAALVLGESSVVSVIDRTGIEAKAAHDAVARLVSGGLVVMGSDGTLVLLDACFSEAAREAAPTIEPAASQSERVLRSFVREGRVVSIPTSLSKRLVIFEMIAQDFEPGLRYSEGEVNAIVGRWHDDYATIRRGLVDELFLSRDVGYYWRSGGAVYDVGS